MHHNPAKNVLYQRAPIDEIAKRMDLAPGSVEKLLQAAKEKMYAARLKRPTPYVDKTVYTGWNALCISAYLEAAKILQLDSVRAFALKSLDRILAESWDRKRGLGHVIAYSDAKAERREISGLLDDYAFTAVACLDAYEAIADLSYFNFAQRIIDQMIDRFNDPTRGGFFDTVRESSTSTKSLGVLGTWRKPFQDSPTPAGNSVAAIALLRLYSYTKQETYKEKAELTLEILAGLAGQYGIFAATYGIAAVYLSEPHSQIVIVGDDQLADQLHVSAIRLSRFDRAVIRLKSGHAVTQNLPPALAETIPNLPAVKKGTTAALICSGFSCKPPISTVEELENNL
jgi:uncharacterized protein YyaL (SSP411 family)